MTLISSHVYCLGAALLSLGEMPSEAVGCCSVLLNNDQVFTSFFLFSFEIISPVTLSLSTPHTVSCYLFEPRSQGLFLVLLRTYWDISA